MNGIIFLVVWLQVATPSGDEVPTAQFVQTFHSMKECTTVKERVESKNIELKHRMACLHVVDSSSDASESL
jgi:hypothetical protein